MRIHTNNLSRADVHAALREAQGQLGRVASDVHFVVFTEQGSRSHARSFDVQLGTYEKSSKAAVGAPKHNRRYKNSGQYGADHIYAATYDEWGWFLAVLFACDSDIVAGPYKGYEGFHSDTKHAYDLRFTSDVA